MDITELKDITPKPIKIISKRDKLDLGISFRDDLMFGSGKPDSRANKREVFADNDSPTGDVRVGDLWFDTNDENNAYRWNGVSWVNIRDGGAGVDNMDDIADGSTYYKVGNVNSSHQITANSIAADAVTASKINVVGLNGSTGRIVVADATDANVVTGAINSYASTTISGSKITTGTITAAHINVSTLSAISADIGTVTAGTITGLTIQTDAAANTGVKMTTGGLTVYGASKMLVKNTSGGSVGQIDGESAAMRIKGGHIYIESTSNPIELVTPANSQIALNSGHGISLDPASGQLVAISQGLTMDGNFTPKTDNASDIGSSSKEFKDAYFDGTVQTDVLRIDQTPTEETPSATHTVTINCNGTNYKFLCLAA